MSFLFKFFIRKSKIIYTMDLVEVNWYLPFGAMKWLWISINFFIRFEIG